MSHKSNNNNVDGVARSSPFPTQRKASQSRLAINNDVNEYDDMNDLGSSLMNRLSPRKHMDSYNIVIQKERSQQSIDIDSNSDDQTPVKGNLSKAINNQCGAS